MPRSHTYKSVAVLTALVSIIGVAAAALPPSCWAFPASGLQAQDAPPQSGMARRIGAVKAIHGNVITLAPDSAPEVAVIVQAATRIVRIPPGEKTLKNATPVQLQDLQVGDRVLAGGKPSEDAKSLTASSIVVMKLSDVEARQEQLRQDWQKRGTGGLVSSVDAATGTVTISVTGSAGTRSIAVHTSKDTLFRRYAPDSVKFEDAKPGTLLQVQPGDQLRARGKRSPDGTEMTAEEIVTGNFRNVAGTVNSVDATAGTVSVQDLLSEKTVSVKITAESQLRKLPAEMAQRIALRLKASLPTGMPAAVANPPAASPAHPAGNGQAPPGTPSGEMGNGMRSGGAPDFQQMLTHLPAVALADLRKGDAVMMVTTQGTPSTGGTAITLLSGVDPILEAAPKGSRAMMLAPWSLGGAPNGDAAIQ